MALLEALPLAVVDDEEEEEDVLVELDDRRICWGDVGTVAGGWLPLVVLEALA